MDRMTRESELSTPETNSGFEGAPKRRRFIGDLGSVAAGFIDSISVLHSLRARRSGGKLEAAPSSAQQSTPEDTRDPSQITITIGDNVKISFEIPVDIANRLSAGYQGEYFTALRDRFDTCQELNEFLKSIESERLAKVHELMHIKKHATDEEIAEAQQAVLTVTDAIDVVRSEQREILRIGNERSWGRAPRWTYELPVTG